MSERFGSVSAERASGTSRCSTTSLRAFVFGDRAQSRYLAGRTLRALRNLGVEADDLTAATREEIAERLAAHPQPAWLIRAGAWPTTRAPLTLPPPSATGSPLCALGAIIDDLDADGDDEECRRWAELLEATGGCLRNGRPPVGDSPPLASVYLEADVVTSLASRIARGDDVGQALANESAAADRRVARLQMFDVRFDRHLRIAQVVTSLQLGGAERVALDLHRTLPEQGIRSRLITLGSPMREAFDIPPGVVDVSRKPHRIEAASRAALDFAADLVHGHLLHADDVRTFAAAALPVQLTIHNMQQGWPAGLATLTLDDAALFVACSQAVEADLVAANLPIPIRTVWNGIDFAPLKRTPAMIDRGAQLRRELQLGPVMATL